MHEENTPMSTAWRPLAGCIRRPRAVFQIRKVTQYPKGYNSLSRRGSGLLEGSEDP